MSILRWEEPPPSERHGRRAGEPITVWREWRSIAEELRAQPKRWALVLLCRNSTIARITASNIRAGNTMRGLGPFEAASRTVGDEFRVYARYVGGNGGEAA